MRTTFKSWLRPAAALFLSFICAGAAIAQEEEEAPKVGFVRLVNAVGPGTGPLKLLINGRDMNPKGYKIGDVTGGMGLKPGTHELTLQREGTEEGKTKVNVALDETTIIIPFAERIPASDEKPAYWALRILRLKQKEVEKGRSATFVSVSIQPQIQVELKEPDGQWTKVFVKRLTTTQAALNYPEGYAPLKTKDGELKSIPISTEGNYVVVLYDDENSKIRAVNFKDLKYLSAD